MIKIIPVYMGCMNVLDVYMYECVHELCMYVCMCIYVYLQDISKVRMQNNRPVLIWMSAVTWMR
jgi:hypothetical protein